MIRYRYLSEYNPQGAAFPGVPLRDLTQAEYDVLPRWIQASVGAAPFFEAVEPQEPDENDPTPSEVGPDPAPEPDPSNTPPGRG